MLLKKIKLSCMILGFLFVIIVYKVLRQPSGYLLSIVSQSTFRNFLHYEWDISDTQNGTANAVLSVEDEALTIRISGNGRMVDFIETKKRTAWHSLQNMNTGWYFNLEKIVIEDGVTYIGKYAFPDFCSVTEITLPKSLEKIGCGAFLNCTSLSYINYSGKVEEWDLIECGDECFTGTKVSKIVCKDGIVVLNECE